MKFTASLFFTLLLIGSGLFFYTWYRFHKKINLHINAEEKPFPKGLQSDTFFTRNKNGQKIAYWYFPVNNAKAIIILIHGFGNPGGKPQMLDHAKYLSEAGYATVLPDLRSFGESEGNKSYLGLKEWEDISVIYDAVQAMPENNSKKIGFMGVSVGAVTALLTAGETGKGDFIIASVPFKNYQSLFTSQLHREGLSPLLFLPFLKVAAIIEFGSNYETFSPENEIIKIKNPVMLLSAAYDEEVDSNDAKILYDTANEPKEFIEFNSKHDIFAERPQEFKESILIFLEGVVK